MQSRVTFAAETLKQVALFLKSRGYDSGEIADILDCDIRTAQRYVKDAREENMFHFGNNFQRDLADHFYKNWRLQCQRLLRESFLEEISPMDRVKIICAHHQMETSGIAIFEQLGFLFKRQGEVDKRIIVLQEAIFKNVSK